jgi:hypothetical protein
MDVPSPIFLPSKQHAQKFLSCQLFAYKEPVNCSAQLFGFAQKILGTKHPLGLPPHKQPRPSFPRATGGAAVASSVMDRRR